MKISLNLDENLIISSAFLNFLKRCVWWQYLNVTEVSVEKLVATWNGRLWRLPFNFTVTISNNKGVKIFGLGWFSTLMPSTGQSNIIALFRWKVVNKIMIFTLFNWKYKSEVFGLWLVNVRYKKYKVETIKYGRG